MCGLIATFTNVPLPEIATECALARMAKRGPDGEGTWHDDTAFLGHRRLSIIDLDARASQPMISQCGRYIVVFNGEIYNYKTLRSGLEQRGQRFRTTSDTEVLLTLFAIHGEECLAKLHGMFAFVIWDKLTRRAFAARDPYGIKPLYIARTDAGVMLASQVKALLATGLVDDTPDELGQLGYYMLGSVPEPHTWFRAIRAVPAGHYLWIDGNYVTREETWCDVGRFWREASTTRNRELIDRPSIMQAVRGSLEESIVRHMVSDVPVGVFLSGGIDSGAVAGLMKDAGAEKLEGITVCYEEFQGKHEDEAPVAAQIANHYGIKHHKRVVTKSEFRDDLPRIFEAMDQPSIDGFNTWYASKAVAELKLKVVVSGVGGDELFFGYRHFRQLPYLIRAWNTLKELPAAGSFADALVKILAYRSGNARWRHAPTWLADVSGAWWLRRSVNAPEIANEIVRKSDVSELANFEPRDWIKWMVGTLACDDTLALAQIESTTYLRNQLLRDSDWASMDHSVELRTPLVDVQLLRDLSPLIPYFRLFHGKRLLATAPKRPLPNKIASRRKTGFLIPVNDWMQDTANAWQMTIAEQCFR